MRRSIAAAALAVTTALLLSGCDYKGLNDFTLPGAEGTKEGSYAVQIEMSDVADLVPNNPVRIGDVTVGNIEKIELDGWKALVTVTLNPEVRLPENVTARVGQVSLLGAKFIEIDQPADPAVRTVAADSRIPLAQAGKYPETEQILASVAALLNGGGLNQLKTITTELDKAIDGKEETYKSLLTELDTFAGGLDDQKDDIVRAIDGLDRLSARFAEQNSKVEDALDALPPALQVLNEQRAKLTSTLTALGDFGVAADDVIQRTSTDLATNVANLEPALRGLADSGRSLTDSLGLLGTIVFPLKGFAETFRGDYVNFWLTLDVTLSTLDRNFLTGTPFAGSLGNFEKVLAGTGGAALQNADPLLAPVQGGQVPPVAGDLLPALGGEAGSQPASRPTDPPSPPTGEPIPPDQRPAGDPGPAPGSVGGLLGGLTGGN
ncbi:MCE family protein [Pseudonocardia sp. WMMC193]|uniref:MCE family protein n=1 Tax=Pseudonocardia sp. WMMC193 TaxID=2911965 RepID=UPI001F249A39|nr:MCE family protein [Pseudonocardia sp. WMMC193]MCF7549540.1 MCE family protein [Pseudonocardia sp. WMMC193]